MALSKIIRSKMFTKYLWVTNLGSSSILMGAGDFIQQSIQRSKMFNEKEKPDEALGNRKPHNWIRTGSMMLVALPVGAFDHNFYKLLDRFLPRKDSVTVIKKIVLDQVIAAPVCMFLFFTGIGKIEGRTFPDSWSELKEKFAAIYLFDWLFWPPIQAVNFYFVPPQLRVIYVNGAILIWDICISYFKYEYKNTSDELPETRSELCLTPAEL